MKWLVLFVLAAPTVLSLGLAVSPPVIQLDDGMADFAVLNPEDAAVDVELRSERGIVEPSLLQLPPAGVSTARVTASRGEPFLLRISTLGQGPNAGLELRVVSQEVSRWLKLVVAAAAMMALLVPYGLLMIWRPKKNAPDSSQHAPVPQH
ncbi:hypothetical protein HY642_02240 [Candidatus Woesearchaeota archaeon]|nr:hypothetical protein [Candidatus Woesearchaeota archaeon]